MKTSCIVEADTTEREVLKRPDKAEQYFHYFEQAWRAIGCPVFGEYPYLPREALKERMVADEYGSERTIRNHLNPSYDDKFIGTLLRCRTIKVEQDGWVVVDQIKASIMLISSDPK